MYNYNKQIVILALILPRLYNKDFYLVPDFSKEEFGVLQSISFSNPDDFPYFISEQEFLLAKKVNFALEKIFGFVGMTLFDVDLLSFIYTKGEFICDNHFLERDHDIYNNINVLSFRRFLEDTKIETFDRRDTYIFEKFTSTILNGYRKKITIVDPIDKDVYIYTIPIQFFLNTIFKGVPPVFGEFKISRDISGGVSTKEIN